MPNQDTPNHYTCNHPKVIERFGKTVSETNLYTTKERLEKQGILNEDDKFILDWINATLDKATSKVEHRKKLQDAIGTGDRLSKHGHHNAYRKSKLKPTDVTRIHTNMLPEGLDKEIESIKYLMEYMDNNKNNNIL